MESADQWALRARSKLWTQVHRLAQAGAQIVAPICGRAVRRARARSASAPRRDQVALAAELGGERNKWRCGLELLCSRVIPALQRGQVRAFVCETAALVRSCPEAVGPAWLPTARGSAGLAEWRAWPSRRSRKDRMLRVIHFRARTVRPARAQR